LHALLVGEGILKTLTKDNTNGEAFTLFVGPGRGFGSPYTNHFAEVPVAWGIETLQMFLRSANHLEIFFIREVKRKKLVRRVRRKR